MGLAVILFGIGVLLSLVELSALLFTDYPDVTADMPNGLFGAACETGIAAVNPLCPSRIARRVGHRSLSAGARQDIGRRVRSHGIPHCLKAR
jgi:hypothetical protein